MELCSALPLEHPVVCVVGPTASGKSELAQQLAEQIDAEIVSADSMQVYVGMDIGTGKVPVNERRVVHHGIDLINPNEQFSAALFQEYARTCFTDIEQRSKRAILCGGTGFYIRAAIDDYHFPAGEQVGNPVREHWINFAREHGAHELWMRLNEADENSAQIIPENDVKRVIRAFELLDAGTSYARQKEHLASIRQHIPACFIGLSVDPENLRKRIDDRVDAMFEQGLVDEVTRLLSHGFREGITSPQAIGYKEVVCALDGQITLDEARQQIKTSTHRYAKRQRTWFRKDTRIRWIDANSLTFGNMLKDCLDIIATIG